MTLGWLTGGGRGGIIPFQGLMFLPELTEEVEEVQVRLLMRLIYIPVVSLVVASAEMALLLVLLSIESEASSTGRIDVTASRYLVGLIWTLSIAILSAVASGGCLLWSRRDAHRLNKPTWVEPVKAFVVGGGAASGSFAVVVALLRNLIDYAEQGCCETPQLLTEVVWMGLFITFFAFWALAYPLVDVVSKPLRSDSGQPGKQGDDNG